MSKKAIVIGAFAVALGSIAGYTAGRHDQKTLDVKVLESYKVSGPARTGYEIVDKAKQFAFDNSCGATTNKLLADAQKKIYE